MVPDSVVRTVMLKCCHNPPVSSFDFRSWRLIISPKCRRDTIKGVMRPVLHLDPMWRTPAAIWPVAALEAVILGVNGISDFDALHSGASKGEVQLCAFDILALDGEDLRDLPLREVGAR
jgi:hypothetical protein